MNEGVILSIIERMNKVNAKHCERLDRLDRIVSRWRYLTSLSVLLLLMVLLKGSLNYIPDGRTMSCIDFGGEYKHCIELLSIKK